MARKLVVSVLSNVVGAALDALLLLAGFDTLPSGLSAAGALPEVVAVAVATTVASC
ncbi:hypothetical protein Syun_031648 [Stephania yunnanensis]|uniref:Uncharacterized protein n=1 Tax=Stephania yunnanensis TaxID=152371 RepID=A0AAP0HCU8_9MAGN